MGLEPHRIRGLIYKLRNSPQQIFATTHSPVVIRELDVSAHELCVCKRDVTGAIAVQSLGTVSDIQAAVRTNAEAFLGSKIVACEGLTEIGCLRAYDLHRLDASDPPIWSLSTSYFNCGGATKITLICPQLIQLGYEIGVLCDNDAANQLSERSESPRSRCTCVPVERGPLNRRAARDGAAVGAGTATTASHQR